MKLASEKNRKTPNNESLNANLKAGILDVDCLQSQQNMHSKGLDVASGNGRLSQKYGNLKAGVFGKRGSQQEQHYVDLEVGESGFRDREHELASGGRGNGPYYGRGKKKNNRRRMNESLEKPPLPPQQAPGQETEFKPGQNGAVGEPHKVGGITERSIQSHGPCQRCQNCDGGSAKFLGLSIGFPTCFGRGSVQNISADLSSLPPTSSQRKTQRCQAVDQNEFVSSPELDNTYELQQDTASKSQLDKSADFISMKRPHTNTLALNIDSSNFEPSNYRGGGAQNMRYGPQSMKNVNFNHFEKPLAISPFRRPKRSVAFPQKGCHVNKRAPSEHLS